MELATLIATMVWLILISQAVDTGNFRSTLAIKVVPLLLTVALAYVVFTGYVR